MLTGEFDMLSGQYVSGQCYTAYVSGHAIKHIC